MIVSWIVALGLIVFAQVATFNMKQVPEGAQNFLEWLVESLYKFLEEVIGPHLAKRTFWFFATIFIVWRLQGNKISRTCVLVFKENPYEAKSSWICSLHISCLCWARVGYHFD